MLHNKVNQCPHWPCHGYPEGIRGWLDVQRCQLCLQDTSPQSDISKQQWVTGFYCVWEVMQDGSYCTKVATISGEVMTMWKKIFMCTIHNTQNWAGT